MSETPEQQRIRTLETAQAALIAQLEAERMARQRDRDEFIDELKEHREDIKRLKENERATLRTGVIALGSVVVALLSFLGIELWDGRQ